MSDNETRRQIIRETVREMLPEVLAEVLKVESYKHIQDKVETRLAEVEKYIKETMSLMNNRQKETLRYLLEAFVDKKQIEETIADKSDTTENV